MYFWSEPEVVFLERCSSMFKEEKRLTGGFDPHSVRVKSVAKDKLEVNVKRVGEEEGYTITLGDRPIKITKRRLESATFWDFIKCLYYKKFSNESPSHKLIQNKLMESFNKVMVDERDLYMSVKLLEAARQHSSVVAVVGRAHLEGIQKNWKQPVDLEQLLVMPRDPVIVAQAVSVGAFLVLSFIIMRFA